MHLAHRLIIALTPIVGGTWVQVRRRRYRRIGRELTPNELVALRPFYSLALLARVRVATVPRINPPPGASLAARLGFGSRLNLSWVRGMAFHDAIVIAGAPPSHSLLFHELVHVVQYDVMGVGPMLKRYVRDYFKSGQDYFDIAAEKCAYDLQARFDASPAVPFDVRDEVMRYFQTPI